MSEETRKSILSKHRDRTIEFSGCAPVYVFLTIADEVQKRIPKE